MLKYSKLFVTGFGLGLIPKAPGTFGSLLGLALVYALSFMSWPIFFAFSIIYCALSLWATGLYLDLTGTKDPKEVVCDEVMGVLITFFLVPVTSMTLIFGFVMFRFFDILKPYPISYFDKKVPGATGVMADDIVAGLFVNIIFHFAILPLGLMDRVQMYFNF